MPPGKPKATHYIHRTSYRFQEQIVGAFVLAAIGILLAMLFTQIKSQNLFEEHFTIYGKLKSAEGINKETIVQVSGFQVGYVAAIEITENNDILVTMNIIRRYHRLLREDSKIKVRGLGAGIIGKSVIVLTAGSPDLDLLREGVTLEIKEPLSIETITAEATKTINTINTVITNIAGVVAAFDPDKLTATLDGLQGMSKNLLEISEQMKSVDGPFGALAYDKQSARNLKRGISNLHKSTEEIKNSTGNLRESTDKFNLLLNNLNTNLTKVPMMLDSINDVIHETRQTIKATQRVWPISSTIESSDQLPTIIEPIPASD